MRVIRPCDRRGAGIVGNARRQGRVYALTSVPARKLNHDPFAAGEHDLAAACLGSFYCRDDLIHTRLETRPKCRLDLRDVGSGILPFERNVLREPCSTVEESIESPLERHGRSVQFGFKYVRFEWIDFCHLPAPRLLPWCPGCSAGPGREWPLQFKRGWRVVPVCNIRHISPRKRQACMRVNGMRSLPGNVTHGSSPDSQAASLRSLRDPNGTQEMIAKQNIRMRQGRIHPPFTP
jgi:hypothetical protein